MVFPDVYVPVYCSIFRKIPVRELPGSDRTGIRKYQELQCNRKWLGVTGVMLTREFCPLDMARVECLSDQSRHMYLTHTCRPIVMCVWMNYSRLERTQEYKFNVYLGRSF